jgi:hypothetical protein
VVLTLSISIQNICIFVLGNTGAEAWIVGDPHHKPSMKIGSTQISLDGRVVSFGSGNPTTGGLELPAEQSELGGSFIDLLADLSQIAPGVRPKKGWQLGDRTLPSGMVTRVVLNGGIIAPVEQNTVGGAKTWSIGPKIQQRLTSLSVFSRSVDDTPFVRIVDPTSPAKPTDIPLVPDAGGVCSVQLGAQDITGQATLEPSHGVVFVTEFLPLVQALAVSAGALPAPYTYWPEYPQETDPSGGPCPQAMLDTRPFSQVLAALRFRFARTF